MKFPVCLSIVFGYFSVVSSVVLVRNNSSKAYDQYDSRCAAFGPRVPKLGLWGHVALVNPVNACRVVDPPSNTSKSWIALIRRQDCNFRDKVLNVQTAGYIGAIVYNVGSDNLVTMNGDSKEITIPSVFVGQWTASNLKAALGLDFSVTIIDDDGPIDPNEKLLMVLPILLTLPLAFIFLGMFWAAKCAFNRVKQFRLRMSRSNLKKLPIKKFKKGDKYEVCAICLEEYQEGARLRVLPCSHSYHQKCIDPWLLKNKQTCPLCNTRVFPRDSDSDDTSDSSTSERTPLISSASHPRATPYGANGGQSNLVHFESDSDDSSDPESLGTFTHNQYESSVEIHEHPRVHHSLASTTSTSACSNEAHVSGVDCSEGLPLSLATDDNHFASVSIIGETTRPTPVQQVNMALIRPAVEVDSGNDGDRSSVVV